MRELMKHQETALERLENGNILYGGVGTGKSTTAIAYYARKESPKDCYVITTAKKRDQFDWHHEAAHIGMGTTPTSTVHGVLTVDSWNNIKKYEEVEGAFFIFDEQRLVGHGAWVQSFLKIAKRNNWILLSGTPGDTWMDYAPVFIGNGWFKNITAFKREHVIYEPYVRFPKVKGYLGTDKLERLRNEILVEMPFIKHTIPHMNFLDVGYNKAYWDMAVRKRWNPFENVPIRDAADLFRILRRITFGDDSRLQMIRKLMECHPRLIIFYQFNYELDGLRTLAGPPYNDGSYQIAEYNGHKHEDVPTSDKWLYLVQYTSGSEGWNCTATDSLILYSLTYSYKNYVQSMGRIDRLDTKYTDLYYYILMSDSPFDKRVRESLDHKENFNQVEFMAKMWQNSANI